MKTNATDHQPTLDDLVAAARAAGKIEAMEMVIALLNTSHGSSPQTMIAALRSMIDSLTAGGKP